MTSEGIRIPIDGHEGTGPQGALKMAPVVRVGKYILKHKIGEGAFTEVRYAMHEDTGKEFAVKVFDRATLLKRDFMIDIRKEIKILQRLRHPNIVSIHTALVSNSRLYLVMELVCGGRLADEIASSRRIDEDSSRRYFQQLTDAVVYCHRRGVFHRDLKPENVLLDKRGNVKVTGFEMSWMSDKKDPAARREQLLQTQCGTPKFMAPEVIDRPSQGYEGSKLDAWDCGIVLYVLLAGYMPFNGEDEGALFRSILMGRVEFPAFFSEGAKNIIQALLEKDPDKRASLEQTRQHPWFEINYFGEPAVPISSNFEHGTPACAAPPAPRSLGALPRIPGSPGRAPRSPRSSRGKGLGAGKMSGLKKRAALLETMDMTKPERTSSDPGAKEHPPEMVFDVMEDAPMARRKNAMPLN